MTGQSLAPCGSWRSPITTELITSSAVGLSSLRVAGADLYWLEARPSEAGRVVLVRRQASGEIQDITAAPFNVRSRVHENGGGAYQVDESGLVFVDFADQRVYCVEHGHLPTPITPEQPLRFADFAFDRARERLYAVREDHRPAGEPENTIVSIPLDGGGSVDDEGKVLARGADFYAYPRLSPDGQQLAWICWHHPNMPWDGTELWVARLDGDGLSERQRVTGGLEESVSEPQWSANGDLMYLSDRTGFTNLYRFDGYRHTAESKRDNDFGGPLWALGAQSYAQLRDGRWVCSFVEAGEHRLGVFGAGAATLIETELSQLGGVLPFMEVRGRNDQLAVLGAGPRHAPRILLMDLSGRGVDVVRESISNPIDPGYISVAESIEFPTEGDRTAHAFFYPPTNCDFRAPEGELPALLVLSHGGPTGATSSAMSFAVQFWTSRGFGVVDVNYGGSTGYGREYRGRLKGNWGLVDVADSVHAVRALAADGRIDSQRACIRGASAGGYTTLAALTFRDLFKAGASHYGIGDLAALARDTHKFESRYLDGLIGPWPEASRIYEERSPIHHTEQLGSPVIFFQGSEDKVVPPNQAESMVEALKEKGVAVGYVLFEGEGHGFRRAENIKRALESELYFYGKVLGFQPADDIEPVEIHGLA
ncbi:MAG: prolyl oligopeptidase family serine peptidase [Myxococcota bacterium]